MNIFLIAKDNIKKKKGDAIVLFSLVVIAIVFLYVGISVISNLNKVIDNINRQINGADYMLVTPSSYPDDIENLIINRPEVTDSEREAGIWMQGAKYYNPDTDKKEDADQLDFIFQNKEATYTISQLKVLDEGKEFKNNSIILPYYCKAGMGFKTGDTIAILYNGNTYEFEIYGFTQEVMFSTPANISVEKCYISDEYFTKINENPQGAVKVQIIRALVKKGVSPEEFENSMQKDLNSKIQDYQAINNYSLNYESMKYGTGITANISMAVLAVFAVLLILIALVVIRFTINTSIESNLKNIGMLQACGYTSGQLMVATLLEIMIIAVAGIVGGFLLANVTAGFMGNIISSSIGLQWKLGFDLVSAGISLLITLLLILTATLLSAGKYRKITPLNALRNGIITHNFKKNRIELEKSKMPLQVALGIKNIVNSKRKNIAICLIVILLSFCCGEAASIYQNFALQQDKLMQLIGFEIPNITMVPQNVATAENSESDPNMQTITLSDCKEQLDKRDEIESTIAYTNASVLCKNGNKQVTIDCDIFDDCNKLTVKNVVEGRVPRYDNEVALTTIMCDKLGAKLGDVIYLELNGTSDEYMLVGITQGITNLGRKGMVTFDGIHRVNKELQATSIYVYSKDGQNVDSLQKELKADFAKYNMDAINYDDYVSGSLSSITQGMFAMCTVLIVVAILVIAMILFLLIKTQLVRDSKIFGIYKALGYTTWQLILQTSMGYIPIVLAGSILGSIAAYFGINPSFILFLSSFGIEKCSMNVSIVYLVIIVILMTVWAELIAVICAARIRKIEPCKMIQE